MAIHDRDYMRKGRPLFGGGDGPWSVATWVVLIGAAVPVAAEAARGWFGVALAPHLALSWSGLRAGLWWTVLTHPFADVPSWRWLFRLALAWFLVRMVEDDLSRLRAAAFLLTAAVAGAAVHAAAWSSGVGARVGGEAALGLAALGTACAAFAAVRRPTLPVRFVFVQVPLWLVAAVWAGGHLAPLLVRRWDQSDVWIHAGALAWGLAAGRFGLVPDLDAWSVRRAQARDRAQERRRTEAEVDVRRRVDALLEKIQAEGMQSLTDAEREFLNNASKRYR